MNALSRFTNVSDLLAHEFRVRRERNRAYTLRSFARDLSISASQISRVLSGKAGLSVESARIVAKKLALDESATHYFLNLVELQFSRSGLGRQAAKEKLLRSRPAFVPSGRDAFKAISEWHHLPLMCLTEFDDFREDPKWIARRLKIRASMVQPAITRLLELNMLARGPDGRLKPTGEYFTNAQGLPSRAIRSFHRQILKKAEAAIEEQNTHERFLSSLVMSIDDEQMGEAQLFLKGCLDEFKVRFANENTNKKQVYALGVQYFGLTDLAEEEKP